MGKHLRLRRSESFQVAGPATVTVLAVGREATLLIEAAPEVKITRGNATANDPPAVRAAESGG